MGESHHTWTEQTTNLLTSDPTTTDWPFLALTGLRRSIQVHSRDFLFFPLRFLFFCLGRGSAVLFPFCFRLFISRSLLFLLWPTVAAQPFKQDNGQRFETISLLFFYLRFVFGFITCTPAGAGYTMGEGGTACGRARSVDDLLSVLPHQPFNQTTKWSLSNGARGNDSKRPYVSST